MSMTPIVDIIDGNNAKLTWQGWEYYRIATITGVVGGGASKVATAVDFLAVYLGAGRKTGTIIGSYHPTIPNCTCEEAHPEMESLDIVKVQLVYRQRFNESEIEVGSSIVEQMVYQDVDGNPLLVKYDHGTPDSDPIYAQQSGISCPRPQTTLTISKILNISPGPLSREFTGKVHRGSPWVLDPTADDRTWLCTGITGRSRDGGDTFSTVYSFQYNEDTWDEGAELIDPTTGKRFAGDDPTYSVKRFRVQGENNFNTLNL